MAGDLPNKTILLLEDDKFLRDIIESHLTKAGFVVKIATTGEEAVKVVGEEHIDLIILDIVLSGISGLDAIARMHAVPGGARIPFIVFTNSDEPASLHRGEELGAAKYLVKAVSTPEKIVHEVKEFFDNATN